VSENITEWLKELDPDMADWVAELINETFNERLEKRDARIAELELALRQVIDLYAVPYYYEGEQREKRIMDMMNKAIDAARPEVNGEL